jgi:signal transduction histidine kinase
MTFRFRLFLLLAATGVIALIGVNLAWLPGAVRDIRRARTEIQAVAARAVREHVDLFLADKEEALLAGARLFRAALLDGDPEGVALVGERFLQQDPAFEDAALVDAGGRVIYRASRRVAARRRPESIGNVPPVETGRVVWGFVTTSDTSEPWVTLATGAGVRSTGPVRLVVALNLRTLWSVIAGLQLRDGGRALIVDTRGIVIAADDPNLTLKHLSFAGHAFASDLFRASPTDVVAGSYRNERGIDVAATGLRVRRAGWSIVVEHPQAVLGKAIGRKVWFFSALAVTGTAVIAALSHIVSRRVTEPVERLRAAAQRLAAGELEYRVDVDRRDEFGALAGQFNEMAEEIRAGHLLLEQRVTRATIELDRQRRAAEELAQVAASLTEELDVTGIAQRVVESARALFSVRSALLRLRQADGSLVAVAAAGFDGDIRPGHVLAAGLWMSGRAIRERRPVATLDVLADTTIRLPEDRRRRLLETGRRAILVVPLQSKSRIIGTLAVADVVGRAFSAHDVKLLQLLAGQAATAIENAQLYEDVRIRAARRKRLTELSQLVNSSLELQQVLDFVTDAARDLLRTDVARLCVVDAQDPELVRLTAESSGTERVSVPQNREFRRGVGVAGWVIEHKRCYYAPNLLEEPLFTNREWARAGGYVSMLMAPMLVGDRVVGTIAVVTRTPRVFSEDERELLELFAAKAATAIHNARLFMEAQAHASALQAKNAELDTFVYAVSHDLKSPLVAIQGMAAMLEADQADRLDESGRRYLERISANVRQMERLIGDLLALSRVGREGRPPEPVAVNEVVDEVVLGLGERMRERGVKLVCGDLGTVVAVRTQMFQIWSNLLSNAVKYLGDTAEPVVEIACVDRGAFVEFAVHDNGIGIDPAYHAQVFEMFQRLKEVEAEGTGVGLPIVKKIVEAAGGRLWVDSAKGQGATFFFTWPKARSV